MKQPTDINQDVSQETIMIDGEEYKKFPFLCNSQEEMVLIYDYYGYWNKQGIEYAMKYNTDVCGTIINDRSRQRTKFLVEHLKPPMLKLKIYDVHEGELLHHGKWHGKWIIWDENNKHIMASSGAVGGCKSEKGVIAYANQRFGELKRLYNGDVSALLVYKKTGIPCLPDWNTNKIDSVGYKMIEETGKYKENRIPRASEVIKDGSLQGVV